MKRLYAILTLATLLSSNLWALMLANPIPAAPYKTLRLSIEYSHDTRKIGYPKGRDFKIESNRVFVKPSYSVISYPLIEMYALLGFGDINMPSYSYISSYNGSWELAGGVGAKGDIAGIYLDPNNDYWVNFYADARFLTMVSRGSVDIGSTMRWDAKYRWNEYNVGAYAALDYTGWPQVKPYLGVTWLYIDGTVDRSAFRYDEAGDPVQFAQSKGFFNDPAQWPKPVIGMDLKLPKSYILSLEMVFWLKEGTCLSVGISQQKQKEADDPAKDAKSH